LACLRVDGRQFSAGPRPDSFIHVAAYVKRGIARAQKGDHDRAIADEGVPPPQQRGAANLPSAAKQARCSAAEIVQLILDRKLARVWQFASADRVRADKSS
jgi:hypothetical protein